MHSFLLVYTTQVNRFSLLYIVWNTAPLEIVSLFLDYMSNDLHILNTCFFKVLYNSEARVYKGYRNLKLNK